MRVEINGCYFNSQREESLNLNQGLTFDQSSYTTQGKTKP